MIEHANLLDNFNVKSSFNGASLNKGNRIFKHNKRGYYVEFIIRFETGISVEIFR